ncbi:hypothetical protein HWV62_8417 [Athelia sp. TMB]|nr:hypothetical protein HWV62_8417 [Athelia sp. TMB]
MRPRGGKENALFSRSNAVRSGDLSRIREDSAEVEESRGHRHRDETYRDLHTNDLSENEEKELDGADEDVAEWDEESTLVALLDSEQDGTKDDDISALVNNLQTPITARGVTLKEHLVHTLIPAAKQVKKAHLALDATVDPLFEEGILLFNDASRNLENLAIRDEDELRTAYRKTQRAWATDEYFWKVHRAKNELDTLPVDLERVITSLDKKSKELEKDGTASAKSKEKMIRDLLANI